MTAKRKSSSLSQNKSALQPDRLIPPSESPVEESSNGASQEIAHHQEAEVIEEPQVEILPPPSEEESASEEEAAESSDQETAETALLPTSTLDRYLAEVRRYPFLTKEEELRLFHEYREHGHREAAVKLILANLRVSVAIAFEYSHVGIDPMDLIQEGNVGLLQAIKKFDPTKNVRFHAYAAWWVRAYILRYLLSNFRLVKIGTTQEQRKLFYNLRKEKAKLESQGFVPDAKLLADRLHVRERDVIEMDQRLGSWELSLDQPISEDSEGSYYDLLASTQPRADEQLADSQLRQLFRQKLAAFAKTLNEREEDILRNRLLSETPVTLEDIGKKYSITKERARQLEAKIIKKLREFMKKELKDFEHIKP
ncbi:MAG: sigma-70 family RNA polymerase sigma factor [Nitrospirae bacterium]|nr:MAG: sigma-70 family RNA polymerase sigma factor [Nitrospirota bacterium]